jgi:hypothetical protein
MKARVKLTGEIVNIKDLYDDGTALVNDEYLKISELDFFSETIDWEQRRYELAKAAMQGFCSNSHEQGMSNGSYMTAQRSLSYADALIKKLKGE